MEKYGVYMQNSKNPQKIKSNNFYKKHIIKRNNTKWSEKNFF
jgi:hypothetical protein